MKRLIALLSVCVFCAFVFAGCGQAESGKGKGGDQASLKIVTTIFPLYDWARNIAPDAEITMLLDNGVDLHSYQPTADDIIKICDADVFLYGGGESDEWVEKVLAKASDKVKAISLLEILGDNVKEEMIVEGMEAEEEEEEEGGEEEPEMDEHIWLSLKNAAIAVSELQKALAEKDPANASSYQANASSYREKIESMEKEYADFFGSISNKTILFADRFPFRYLADDYGLTYYAAFAGCSAETESSFETILFLAQKVDELKLKTVYVTETSDGKIAKTVIENSKERDAKIVTINALQSITGDKKDKVTYLALMAENLKAFQSSMN